MKKMKYSKNRFYKKLLYQTIAQMQLVLLKAQQNFEMLEPRLNLSDFKEGTWILQKGERVVNPKENADLKEFLKGMTFKDGTTIEIIN